ncbi:MAG: carboxypeptidase-like regulatory domain-containing protein, partial [Planctomycetota bacterium]
LRVHLIGPGGVPADARGWELSGSGERRHGVVPADGAVDLTGCAAGSAVLSVIVGESVGEHWYLTLPNDLADGDVLPVGGPGAIDLILRGSAADRVRHVGALATIDGRPRESFHSLSGPVSRVSLAGLALGAQSLRLLDEQLEPLAKLEVELTEQAPRATREVSLEALGWRMAIVDAAGQPAAGVVVALHQVETGAVLGSATTDAAGSAVIEAVGTRSEALASASSAGSGCALGVPVGSPASLESPSGAVEIQLDASASLTVEVHGPDGPLGGVDLQLADGSATLGLADGQRTDAAGQARFEALAPGDVTLFATAPGYLPEWPQLRVHGADERLVLALSRTGSFEVWVRDASGAPVSGATVRIRRPGLDAEPLGTYADRGVRSVPPRFMTGADGQLAIEGLPLTVVELDVTADGLAGRATVDAAGRSRVEVVVQRVESSETADASH